MTKNNPPRAQQTADTEQPIRLRTPEDVLAAVPYCLGFHPVDSLVMVTVAPSRPFFARIDLPADPRELATVVEPLVEAARRHGTTRVLLAAYSDDASLAEAAHTTFAEHCGAAGIEVPIALRADGARWFALGGDDPGAASGGGEGTPYDLGSHVLTAQAVLEGKVIQPSREALRDSLRGGDPDETGPVGEAADAATMRLTAAGRTSPGQPSPEGIRRHLVQEGHWVRKRVRQYLEDHQPLCDDEAGRLLVALRSLQVRDVAWSEMTRDDAEVHVGLWRDLVRRCPEDLLAAPAALLGFAAWLAGDGALAWCAVERCQDVDPDYGLAGLVGKALAGAVPPDVWRPLDGSALSLFAG